MAITAGLVTAGPLLAWARPVVVPPVGLALMAVGAGCASPATCTATRRVPPGSGWAAARSTSPGRSRRRRFGWRRRGRLRGGGRVGDRLDPYTLVGAGRAGPRALATIRLDPTLDRSERRRATEGVAGPPACTCSATGRRRAVRGQGEVAAQAGAVVLPARGRIERKTAELVERIDEVEWSRQHGERGAAARAELIKRHRPPFNIRLRDDKSYPYIAVTVGDEYPRVMFTRERHRKGVPTSGRTRAPRRCARRWTC